MKRKPTPVAGASVRPGARSAVGDAASGDAAIALALVQGAWLFRVAEVPVGVAAGVHLADMAVIRASQTARVHRIFEVVRRRRLRFGRCGRSRQDDRIAVLETPDGHAADERRIQAEPGRRVLHSLSPARDVLLELAKDEESWPNASSAARERVHDDEIDQTRGRIERVPRALRAPDRQPGTRVD